MRNPLTLLIICLFFGGGLGFLMAAMNGVTLDGHEHSAASNTGDHTTLHVAPLMLADDGTAPKLNLVLRKDDVSGYNLEVLTQNFAFAPNQVNLGNQPNVGHAHVYVNGEKRSRIYGPWMHLTDLPVGEVTISVSLNANDHSPIFVDGAPASASATITVED